MGSVDFYPKRERGKKKLNFVIVALLSLVFIYHMVFSHNWCDVCLNLHFFLS